MLLLSWKVTLLALLVVPGFVAARPAHGQAAGHAVPPADGLQRRHVVDHGRAAQRGRRPAGQAVRPAPLRGRRVRRPGGGGAGVGRAPGRAEPPLLRRPGHRRRHRDGRRLLGRRPGPDRRDAQGRHADRPRRLRLAACTRRSPTWPAPGSTSSPPSSASSGSSRCSTRPRRSTTCPAPPRCPPRSPAASTWRTCGSATRRRPPCRSSRWRARAPGSGATSRRSPSCGACRSRPSRGRWWPWSARPARARRRCRR